jgi:hypothetical protein
MSDFPPPQDPLRAWIAARPDVYDRHAFDQWLCAMPEDPAQRRTEARPCNEPAEAPLQYRRHEAAPATPAEASEVTVFSLDQQEAIGYALSEIRHQLRQEFNARMDILEQKLSLRELTRELAQAEVKTALDAQRSSLDARSAEVIELPAWPRKRADESAA